MLSQRNVKVRRGSVNVTTLNPKCVTVGELYGEINSTTMEWKDGLLSHVYRKYAKESRGMIRGARRKQSNAPAPNTPNTARLSRTSSAKSISTSVSAISLEDNSEGERFVNALTSHLHLKGLSDKLIGPLIGSRTLHHRLIDVTRWLSDVVKK